MRVRRWCFTWNFPSPDDVQDVAPDGISYYVIGMEVAPETGRPHLQGYVEWKNGKSLGACVASLGMPGVHVEVANGSPQQNRTYCTKDGDYVESGTISHQGARNDLVAVKEMIDQGASMRDVAEEHFSDFVRYSKGFQMYKRMKAERRNWAMEIHIIVGPTGTGKTRHVRDLWPDAYWKPKGKWWDNYYGEEVVVIDEMYGSSFPYTELLQLMDRYPYSVESKGGTVEFSSRILVFTSNQMPEDWYDQVATHQGSWKDSPLRRRIDEYATIIRTGEVHRRIRPRLVGYGPE